MKNINKILLFFCMLLCSVSMYAQKSSIEITGVVRDEMGEPLIGANVVVKNQPGFGTTTDLDGNYKIKTGANEVLVVSYIGYSAKEVPVGGKTKIDVVLEPDTEILDEVVVVAGNTIQRKASVVGAITTVDVSQLKVPTSNISNALAGNVAGIIGMQTSGEPGQNFTEFWIRGISTFGANASALVLVDGIERSFNELNVEDIESFSVLKDASATAIYGQRGANGVIIVTTKKGKEGKVQINFKGEYGLATPSRMPEYVDAMTYANLANEARASRYQDPIYTPSEMEIIRYGLDPDIYPNVDWHNELLKDVTQNYRASLNVSGGGSTARYFISGSYLNEEGMYKTDNLKNYSTNANYRRYNYRSNVDVNITKSTILELGIGGWVVDQNKPGSKSDDIWGSLSRLTATTVPIRYSDGKFPTYGTGNQTNPLVLLKETGYKTIWENKMETNVGLRQDFSFITKGLSFFARFSYDSYNYHEVARLKQPDLYKAEKQRDGRGNLILRRIQQAKPMYQESVARGDRRYYTEGQLAYDNVFAGKHRVSGLMRYTQEETTVNDAGADIFKAIPKRYLALAARGTYSFDDRYFVEFNYGYTGSENFEKKKRFGSFPAIAGGWMISNEKFVSENLPWLKQLKVRYSYGLTGNDQLENRRFPYMSQIENIGGYTFGETGQTGVGGIDISEIGTPNLTWEISKKHNLGVDLGITDNFNLTMEIFQDQREDIFMKRSHMPGTVGLDGKTPWANVGRMNSKGVDGNASYSHQIGKVNVTVRGNWTFSKSDVLEFDEAANAEYYQMTRGYRYGQTRGYISLGLFKDEDDVKNSPNQFGLNNVLPGDIKYKDVNGDGKITDKDIVPIGYSTKPSLTYGMGASANWNGFDFNFLFQGSGSSDFFVNGAGVYPFVDGETGNILTSVAKPEDRWISREISGTADTERANAIFPRLSYGANTNNYQASTFWLRDSRYIRLKNVELGYTLPKTLTKKWLMENVRVYFLGNNLLIFDKFGWWDPELGSSDGAKYPISRNFTVGLQVGF